MNNKKIWTENREKQGKYNTEFVGWQHWLGPWREKTVRISWERERERKPTNIEKQRKLFPPSSRKQWLKRGSSSEIILGKAVKKYKTCNIFNFCDLLWPFLSYHSFATLFQELHAIVFTSREFTIIYINNWIISFLTAFCPFFWYLYSASIFTFYFLPHCLLLIICWFFSIVPWKIHVIYGFAMLKCTRLCNFWWRKQSCDINLCDRNRKWGTLIWLSFLRGIFYIYCDIVWLQCKFGGTYLFVNLYELVVLLLLLYHTSE